MNYNSSTSDTIMHTYKTYVELIASLDPTLTFK